MALIILKYVPDEHVTFVLATIPQMLLAFES